MDFMFRVPGCSSTSDEVIFENERNTGGCIEIMYVCSVYPHFSSIDMTLSLVKNRSFGSTGVRSFSMNCRKMTNSKYLDIF